MAQARNVAALWLAEIEYAPGAVRHLAARGQAVRFAAQLRDDQARNLWQSVARRFALPQVLAQCAEPGAAPRTETAPMQAVKPFAPWQSRLPDSQATALTTEQQTFLGMVLTLLADPIKARSRAFAVQAGAWRKAAAKTAPESFSVSEPSELPPRRTPEAAASRSPSQATDEFTEHLPDVSVEQVEGVTKAQPKATRPARFVEMSSPDAAPDVAGETNAKPPKQNLVFATETRAAKPAPDAEPTKPRTKRRMQQLSFHKETQQSKPARARARAPAPAETVAPETATDWLPETSLATECGGVFYLLNLALYLELYGDFTKPLEPGLALDMWDFVALLGRRLLGAKLENDAVWPLLAELAGRETGVASGAGFASPTEWRLPAQWLKPWRTREAWQWQADARRLRIWHPAGFLVADVKRRGDAEQQLAAELARFGDFRPAAVTKLNSLPRTTKLRPLERWLGWLWPYVEARLRFALGLEAGEDLAAELCLQPARVLVTTTHLDVIFSLAGLSYAVRLSGLDRDPGWIPAAGKYVKFHYE